MYKYLLFDLDGTLTDPAQGITNSILYALREMGVAPLPPRESLYRYIGPPLSDSFAELFAGQSPGDGMERSPIDQEKIALAIETYRVYFRKAGMFENEVYPGIADFLASMKQSGVPMAVATSKPEDFAVTILKHFHLAEFFAVIGGASMDGVRGEKRQVIEYTLARLNAAPEECIMIGDRMYDITGAAALGMAAIGVTWGYGSRDELEKAGASAIADTPEELYEMVKKSLGL